MDEVGVPPGRARTPGAPLEKKKTAPERGLQKQLEPNLRRWCRYCFGGVVAGALGAAGLVAGLVAGRTGF